MNTRTVGMLAGVVLAAGVSWGQVEVEWERTFNREIYGRYRNKTVEHLTDLIRTTDGGFILVGQTEVVEDRGYIHRQYDNWLVRTDSEGELLWLSKFGGEGDDACQNIIQLEDGSFLLGVTSYPKVWILQVNDEGDSVSSWTYDDHRDWRAFEDIRLLPEGGFVMALQGTLRIDESHVVSVPIVQFLDRNGQVLGSCQYDSLAGLTEIAILNLRNGDFAFIGLQNSWRGLVMRLNHDLEPLWLHRIDRHFVTDIAELNNGFLSVSTWTGDDRGEYIRLMNLNRNGDINWEETYLDTLETRSCNAMITTIDHGYAMVGDVFAQRAPGRRGGLMIKTDSSGVIEWSFNRNKGGLGNVKFKKVLQEEDDSYVIAGESSGDFYLLKTTPDPASVSSSLIPYPSSLLLEPPYPNPFNFSTRITFGLDNSRQISLAVFDPLGRRVADLIPGSGDLSRRYPVGTNSIVWNAAGYPAGVYLLRLESPGASVTQKLMLVK